ncbi:helix-turn-helix domain-containing protein [Undibacterium sp. MH2W]|uniref:helix-turn-helix domain-containing protein n=1 Tax=Undibacterium sp. MH2W TaxID=3413044 RepID=UPI003BF4142C
MSRGNVVFSLRLKTLRLEQNLSQKQLGIEAGIDKFVASTRINRYEQSVHAPDYAIVQMLAKVLNAPVAYFFAEEDDIAGLLISYHRMDNKEKKEVLKYVTVLNSQSIVSLPNDLDQH